MTVNGLSNTKHNFSSKNRWFESPFSNKSSRYRLVPEKINAFLSNNQISYVPLSPDELRSNAADLKTLHPNFRKDKYYKVPFEEALDLVKHRKVLLKRGNAYVPEDELSTIILARYKVITSHSKSQSHSIPN